MNCGSAGAGSSVRTVGRSGPRVVLLAAAAIASATAAVGFAAGTANAEGVPDLGVPSHAIANGGGSSSGGAFAISGTIGQVDADPLQPASGGVFAITGGFWPTGVAPPSDPIFANGFEN